MTSSGIRLRPLLFCLLTLSVAGQGDASGHPHSKSGIQGALWAPVEALAGFQGMARSRCRRHGNTGFRGRRYPLIETRNPA